MRLQTWILVVVVYVMYAHSVLSRSSVGKHPHLASPNEGLDWRLEAPYTSSFFISALGGLRKTRHRKRTAMGMDLTDYLWSKAHEKHRAMLLQRMMQNGRRR